MDHVDRSTTRRAHHADEERGHPDEENRHYARHLHKKRARSTSWNPRIIPGTRITVR